MNKSPLFKILVQNHKKYRSLANMKKLDVIRMLR